LWKTLWALKIHLVLKLFVWKLCYNLLPTKAKLFSKKIIQDLVCPLCLDVVETSCHILWNCPSMVVWQDCNRCVQKQSINAIKGRNVVKELLAKLNEEEIQEVFTVDRLLDAQEFICFWEALHPPEGKICSGVDQNKLERCS